MHVGRRLPAENPGTRTATGNPRRPRPAWASRAKRYALFFLMMIVVAMQMTKNEKKEKQEQKNQE